MGKPFENLAIRLGYHLLKYCLHDRRMDLGSKGARRRLKKIYDLVETHRRAELGRDLATLKKFTVQNGFFTGLAVPPKTSWGDDIMPKILGTYEEELFPVFETLKDRSFAALINIGCADGFFAVGLAQRLEFEKVFAIDISSDALEICKENRAANGVTTPFDYMLSIDQPDLERLLADQPDSLVLCDCEGFELELFDGIDSKSIERAVFIIECHDFVDQSITERIQTALRPTHDLTLIEEGGRNPNAFTELKSLSNSDRWQAMNELRPETMHWIIAKPKGSPNAS